VATSIAHAVGAGTWVVTLQNGLDNDTALAAVLGSERVLPGTTTAGAMKNRPGVVEVSPITAAGGSLTQLGPPRCPAFDPAAVEPLTSALTNAGLPCELLTDAEAVIWTKLAMAATAGPLTAMLGTTVQGLVDSAAGRDLLRAMFDEILAVAAAEGVELDGPAVWQHAVDTYEAVGPHVTSMAADVAAGRRSEIDSFCRAISARGRRCGVVTPTHDVVGQLIVAREQERGLR
jgi:2-dehydropantoate 2-reductase